MRRLKLKFATAMLFAVTGAIAQTPPTHPVISGYSYNAPAGYSRDVLPGAGSHMQAHLLDVAVVGNFDYQCGTATFNINGVNSSRMFLCKKNALTGAPVTMGNFNMGEIFGGPSTTDICKGMLVDNANNRIYLFGTSQATGSYAQAVVICYNQTTMALDPGFAFGWGATSLSGVNSASDVTDMDMVGSLNGGYTGVFVALVNQTDPSGGVSYISMPMLDQNGAFVCQGKIINAAYGCFGRRIKTYDGVFHVAGSAVSGSQKIPMLWRSWLDATTCTALTTQTAANFATPPHGYGEFVDFVIDNTNSFRDIIAIGNTTAKNGIWGKYRNTGAPNFVLSATFKGTKVGNFFTRGLFQPDGFTVILTGHVPPANGKLGYINLAGTAYTDTRTLLTIESTGLNNDPNGNIIVGGCYGSQYTTAKFASYTGFWGGSANKTEGPLAISNVTDEMTVNMFPNPATNTLTLVYNGGFGEDKANIQVMDISGKKVLEMESIAIVKNKEIKLDLTDLKKGAYFIRVVSNEKSIIKKIVKQ